MPPLTVSQEAYCLAELPTVRRLVDDCRRLCDELASEQGEQAAAALARCRVVYQQIEAARQILMDALATTPSKE